MCLKLPILSAIFVTDELWGDNLAWLNRISDIAIAVSYYTVSLLIIYLIHQLTVEIKERKKIAVTLHRQIQLEQLIGDLCDHFINVSVTELDSAISQALSSISEFVGVDGSYLLLLTKQNQQWQVVQKWSVPESDNLPNLDRTIESQIPWIMSNIQSNKIVNLPQIDTLPATAERDRLYLTTNKIKSLLIVPMFYYPVRQGMLALEAVNQSYYWTERDIQLLKLTGEIISGAIERCCQARELSQTTQQLETANKELETFAYIVSHELSEPLRSISGFSYLLQEEYQSKLNQEAQEYLNFIKNGAARMKQLIDDLLAFSRVGSQNLTLTLIDCEKIIEEVISNLQAVIIENNVQINYEHLPKIIGDQTQLTQLWQNLIANAIKFRQPELTPKIHISATQNSQNLIFKIRDNGIGIDPQYVEEIFCIFRRLNDRQKYPGTGIGLTICRRIAELHGGKIWVESSLGNGSNFYVFLPIHNQPELGNEDNN